MVIPKPLRDRLGLRPGELELTVEGAALRLEPVHDDELIGVDGLLVIPSAGATITAEDVTSLRDADKA